MGKNRNRLDIVAAILEAAAEGSSKTHIMYRANLSFSLLEKYLGLAFDSGLLEQNASTYHLTSSGKDFLRNYQRFEEKHQKVQEMLEILGSERERLTSTFKRSNGVLESSEGVLESE